MSDLPISSVTFTKSLSLCRSKFCFSMDSEFCCSLEKAMATHSSVLAWRIPGTVEPGGLRTMGSHRVGHDWSDLAAAAAGDILELWFQMGISFLFSFAFLLRFFTQPSARSPQINILLFCISFSWRWSWSLSPVQCHKPPSIVHQALCLSDLVP